MCTPATLRCSPDRARECGERRARRADAATPAPAEEEAEEEEPEWELPEELREYAGDPADRKAMLSFRQAQAAARQARHTPPS
jgi:hypothetical protein